MARSLNKVELIGNLTRDPELRYTPQGTAVCTFGIATNRYWTTESGEKKEDVEFHRIVAWQKLAELCGQLLTKGRKVYVEGRLQTRRWTSQDGQERTTTEVVINDMIILDSRSAGGGGSADFDIPDDSSIDEAPGPHDDAMQDSGSKGAKAKGKPASKKTPAPDKSSSADDAGDDIPF